MALTDMLRATRPMPDLEPRPAENPRQTSYQPAGDAFEPPEVSPVVKQVKPVGRPAKPATKTADLTEDVSRQLAGIARRVLAHRKRETLAILERGRDLAEARDLLLGVKAGFSRFLKDKCKVSRSAAYRDIAAYEAWGAEPTTAKLIDAQALRVLARSSSAALAEARTIVDEGQPLTVKEARAIAAKHAAKTQSSKPQPKILRIGKSRIAVQLGPNDDLLSVLTVAVQELTNRRKTKAAA